jgi:hypothetical protein
MLQVVQQLRTQGHRVTYYKRLDGGILIKSIDGEKFKAAKGNIAARALTSTTLSEARSKQLKYATRTRKKIRVRRKKGNISIDEQIKSEYDKVKQKWNKAFKAKKGKPHPAGYFGWERIQYSIEHYGKEEALRRIREAEKYASGIAYSKNVEELIVFIRIAANAKNSQELRDVATDLEEQAYMIRDEWIAPAYDELYKLNQGADPKEVASNLRKILRLKL